MSSEIDFERAAREAEQAQRESAPKEDLSPYRGEWVALRKGYVVGHDRELARLTEQPDVRDDDVLWLVPLERERYY
jgi:hypothetical protein